jgi:RNA recognition motif-containing protein
MEHTNPPSSTLFLPDLPAELPELDLQALFQSQEGFKSARIREDRNKNLVGFVEFEDSNFASRARDRFNGQRPLPLPHALTIQFARTKEPSPYGDGYRRRRDGPPRSNNNNVGLLGAGNGAAAAPGAPMMPAFFSPVATPLNYANPYQVAAMFPPQLPADASSTLYVEGLPLDATEREVAHIFRQWPGFQSLRILPKVKESTQNNPTQAPKFVTPHPTTHTYHLCFVEFDNKTQATLAMCHLNGYRFDLKNDTKGLVISYAKSDRKDKKTGIRKKE